MKKPFEGVIPNLERRLRETDNPWVREDLSRYQSNRPCHVCRGARLKPEALAVKVAGLQHRRGLRHARSARPWSGSPASHGQLNPQRQEIARRILREINDRLRFLVDVGLDYLVARPRQRHACRAARASASAWRPRSARA